MPRHAPPRSRPHAVACGPRGPVGADGHTRAARRRRGRGLLSAIAARHFAGWTLRRARNCRFSASLNVASYARRARASYRQATSATTANTIGTAKGIIADRYHDVGQWRTAISVTFNDCGDAIVA